MSRINTHNTEISAGDVFGNTYVTDLNDSYPLLAHSGFSETWPKKWNPFSGSLDSFWPGSWAKNYNINLPGCSESRKDPDCWEKVEGRFTSDMDVYMEFDDRWAHRGNQVNTNNEYEQTGYPMGLRVMSEAHSYGVSYAEDILFVTVTVRNESGDWCANDEFGNPILDENDNSICGEAMIMPDGTKLNQGKGFNYRGVSLGFWNDGVIVSGDKYGNTNSWTSADDYMKYYWEVFEVNNERHLISMAMIGDYDGYSLVPGYAMDPNTPSPGNQFGLVATQLLDSPKATTPIDLDKDGDKKESMKKAAQDKKKGMGEQVHLNDISKTYLDQVANNGDEVVDEALTGQRQMRARDMKGTPYQKGGGKRTARDNKTLHNLATRNEGPGTPGYEKKSTGGKGGKKFAGYGDQGAGNKAARRAGNEPMRGNRDPRNEELSNRIVL